MRIANAKVRRSALLHNYEKIKQMSHNKPVMVILKANAYGHGISEVARTLRHADSIGVASIQEAVKLREEGIQTPIVLLEGVNHCEELPVVEQYHLDCVIHNDVGLALFMGYEFTQPVRVWLKFDSGMHRLGFSDSVQFKTAYRTLKAATSRVGQIVLMSHLSCADDMNSPETARQLSAFNRATEGLEALRCVANSAGTLAWPESHYDYVRSGLMLFGCSPLIGGVGSRHQLEAAMNFESEVIAIKSVKAGDAVGYGQIWRTPQDATIAIVSVGYGDGYPRHARPGTPVWINGQTYPLVGRVSMDMLSVRVDAAHPPSIGDRVVLWGQELPVETVARHADTIPYQLLCCMTQRVAVSYSDR